MGLLTSQTVKGICFEHWKHYQLLLRTMRGFSAQAIRCYSASCYQSASSWCATDQKSIRSADHISRRISCCHGYRQSQNCSTNKYSEDLSKRSRTRLNFYDNRNSGMLHEKCSVFTMLNRGFRPGICHRKHKMNSAIHIGTQCFMSSKNPGDSIESASYTDDYDSESDTEDDFTDDVTSLDRPLHVPVMVKETIHMLDPKNEQLVVDMTFGAGGHTRHILQHVPQARIIALDRDPTAYQLAQKLSEEFEPGQIIPLLGRFSELPQLLSQQGIQEESIDGFLFDVGASSIQFDQTNRGFSLSTDGPLDMRMDADRDTNQPTAADVVNYIDEQNLYRIIKKYGEDKNARVIAHAIIEARYAFGKITRTRQLADIIGTVLAGSHRRDKLRRHSHVATRTFQALRIFINNELNELHNGLEVANHYLKPGGICAVLTFHSLEDRIVKRHFHGIDIDSQQSMSIGDQHRNAMKIHSHDHVLNLMDKRWQSLTKKVVTCSDDEMAVNPRARSAKLRAARKSDKS